MKKLESDYSELCLSALYEYFDLQKTLVKLSQSNYKNLESISIDKILQVDNDNLSAFTNYLVKQNNLINALSFSSEVNDVKKYVPTLESCSLQHNTCHSIPKKVDVLIIGETNHCIDDWLNSHEMNAKHINNYINDIHLINEAFNNDSFEAIIAIPPKANDDEVHINFIRNVFLAIKYFAISNLKAKSHAFIYVIHFLDGYLGQTQIQNNPISLSVTGLLKSLNREWGNNINIKYIDMDSNISRSDFCKVIDNEFMYGQEVEVGIKRDATRFIVKLKEVKPITHNVSLISEDDVLIVTGGARGITSLCIRELAKKSKCKFVLLGRTDIAEARYMDFEKLNSEKEIREKIISDNKANNLGKTPKVIEKEVINILAYKEINNTINDLENAGSSVMYYSCNINNINEVQKVIVDLSMKGVSINGIIHGAGVIADKLIEDKTLEDFLHVYYCKYMGLKNIVNLLRPESLKYLVLFSSVAGFFGNIGQIDYSSVNEFLNYFAREWGNLHPTCFTLAINWGAWDAGMVKPSLRKEMKKRGVKLISKSQGVSAFMNLINSKTPFNSHQVIVNHTDTWGI